MLYEVITNEKTITELAKSVLSGMKAAGKDISAATAAQVIAAITKEYMSHDYKYLLDMIEDVPKFGNDIEEVDEMARDAAYTYTKPLETFFNPRGGQYQAVITSYSIHYTKLYDVMPNGALSNSNIINVTREPQRRVDLIVSIAYDANLLEVKQILESIARKSEYLLQDQPIDLYVDKFADNAINIGFRCWAAKENFWLLRVITSYSIHYTKLYDESFSVLMNTSVYSMCGQTHYSCYL